MAADVSFPVLVAAGAGAVVLAVVSQKLSRWARVPAPVFFLVAAAVAAVWLPSVTETGRTLDERVVSLALVFVLFDGGMGIGWRRFRASAVPIVWLGIAGTGVTAAAIVMVGHVLLGLGWQLSLLLGAALSPTDPAAVFSVLGNREVSGRVATILEGESGANDPVGIAIVASLLAASGAGWASVGSGLLVFVTQLVVGAAVGVVGGFGLRLLLQHVRMPSAALASVLAIASAALLYGIGSVAHGSGFLAVLVAGIVLGDARAPYKADISDFASGVSSLAEIVAFVVLGLTVRLDVAVRPGVLIAGIVISILLIFVIRPLLVGALSLPLRLAWGERGFLVWAGLRGAVPILLGLTIVSAQVPGSQQIYGVIFVVVLASVLVQGSLVPPVARLFRVPMREVEARPFALDVRFAHPPEGLHRFVVESGSAADGAEVRDLFSGSAAWVSLAARNGHNLPMRPSTVLRGGDVVMAQGDEGDLAAAFRAAE